MQSNEGFALNVIKKALNSPIKDQVDALAPNYFLLNVWNAVTPIALL